MHAAGAFDLSCVSPCALHAAFWFSYFLMNKFLWLALATGTSAFRGGRSSSLLGIEEDYHGLTDPATYERSVFSGAETYEPNRIERRPAPSSFVQTTDWQHFFEPFGSLEEAKAAQLKESAADEAETDHENLTRTKIEAFKADLQAQVDSARKERKESQDRLARGPSSLIQSGSLQPDFAARELQKISEMQRGWKLGADRLGHSELASVNEPNAALIDANSRVEADRKKLGRLTALVNADLERVDNDASVVANQQAKLRKEQHDGMYV